MYFVDVARNEKIVLSDSFGSFVLHQTKFPTLFDLSTVWVRFSTQLLQWNPWFISHQESLNFIKSIKKLTEPFIIQTFLHLYSLYILHQHSFFNTHNSQKQNENAFLFLACNYGLFVLIQVIETISSSDEIQQNVQQDVQEQWASVVEMFMYSLNIEMSETKFNTISRPFRLFFGKIEKKEVENYEKLPDMYAKIANDLYSKEFTIHFQHVFFAITFKCIKTYVSTLILPCNVSIFSRNQFDNILRICESMNLQLQSTTVLNSTDFNFIQKEINKIRNCAEQCNVISNYQPLVTFSVQFKKNFPAEDAKQFAFCLKIAKDIHDELSALITEYLNIKINPEVVREQIKECDCQKIVDEIENIQFFIEHYSQFKLKCCQFESCWCDQYDWSEFDVEILVFDEIDSFEIDAWKTTMSQMETYFGAFGSVAAQFEQINLDPFKNGIQKINEISPDSLQFVAPILFWFDFIDSFISLVTKIANISTNSNDFRAICEQIIRTLSDTDQFSKWVVHFDAMIDKITSFQNNKRFQTIQARCKELRSS